MSAVLAALSTRHPALRTRFAADGTELIVEPEAAIALPVVDLAALPATAQEAEARRLGLAAARRPFLSTRAPLVRCPLLRLGPHHHHMLLVIHHAVVDGHSQGEVLGELRRLYAAGCQGEPARLAAATAGAGDPEPPPEEDGARRRASEDWWVERFAGGLPRLDLPTDRPRPAMQSFRADRVERIVGPAPTDRLRRFAGASGGSLFMTLLAGLALLLHRLSGQDELVVGVNAVELAGRRGPRVGFHTHPVVVPSRIGHDPTTAEHLAAVRRAVVESYQYQDVSFARLLRRLGVRRDPSRPPLAAVVLNLDRAKPDLDLLDLRAGVSTLPSGARTELTLNVSERADSLRLVCDFDRALFRPGTVSAWLEQLGELLEQMASEPEAPVSRWLADAPRQVTAGPPPRAASEILPLTRYQQLLWMAQQLEPDSPQLGAPFVHRLAAPVDPVPFREAWESLVAASDALRTVFLAVDGAPGQRVLPAIAAGYEEVDLSSAEAPDEELLRWAAERGRQPLPIDRRSFDSVLVRLGAERWAWYLNTHHLVADAWALGLILRRLDERYQLALAGRLVEAPALPPFAALVADEQDYLATPEARRAERFWNDLLARTGEPPAFFGHTVRTSTRVRRVTRRLGEARSRRLSEQVERIAGGARSSRAALAAAFHAVVVATVHRLSAAERVILGTPHHHRAGEAFKETIGSFMQIVPLPVEVGPGDGLTSLLAKVLAAQDAVYPHRRFPLGNPIDRPAYDVESNFIVAELASFAGAPAEVVWVHPGRGRESLAVHARDFAGTGDLEIDFDLHADVFAARERELAVESFFRLLDAWLEEPARPLGEVPWLTAAERHELVVERNATAAPRPAGRTFGDLFRERAAGSPDAVAVVQGERVVTYGELATRAEALAAVLAGRGVGVEDVVAVAAPRGIELLVALTATLLRGAVYLPLDPQSPARRLAGMLGESGTVAVLASGAPGRLAAQAAALAAGESGEPVPVLAIESVAVTGPGAGPGATPPPTAGDAEFANPMLANPAPANLAYLIYTSGSTGSPKGAMVHHEGLLNHLLAKLELLGLDAGDAVIQNAPAAFDVSLWQLLAPLLVGARVVFVDDEESRDPARLLDRAARHEATVLETVPALLRELVRALDDGAGVPSELRWLLSTGEALPVDLWREVGRVLPGTGLVNAYGPTECADDVTHAVLARTPPPGSRRAPIGRALPNLRLYVLDSQLRALPAGLVGELFVAGTGVGRGYHGDPRRTATAFVPDPYNGSGQRMYATGDRVRFQADDTLEMLGRRDHQVKIRGARIEPGEVEAALREHPEVDDAAVVARSLHDGAEPVLVAYVVTATAAIAAEAITAGGPLADWREFLGGRLPAAMMPAVLVPLAALPQTANGKLDRAALPAPPPEAVRSIRELVAPRDDKERLLAGIWRALLGVEQVGVHDDFFELGGDSILALQIVSRVHREGLQLSPAQVFERPTIAELAEVAVERTGPLAEQGPVVGEVPLTPVQHWFFELDPADAHHYNQTAMLAGRTRLDAAVLRRVIGQLLTHHDALRARFRPGPEGWGQTFGAPGARPPCAVVDLAALPEPDRLRAVESAAAAAQRSLDLGRGPLLRAVHFSNPAPAGDRLLLLAHHLVIDGVSWRVLLEDLEAAYHQLAAGVAAELPAKTSSFRAWSSQLAERAGAPAVEMDGLYWLSQAWREVPALPVDRAAEAVTAASTRSVRRALDEATTRALLQEVPERFGVRQDAVLLAAFGRVLAEWTGSRWSALELEAHGREDFGGALDLSRTVGWFTAMYPLVLEIGLDDPAEETLARVETQLSEVPGGGVSFGLLRHLSGSPTAARLRSLPRPEVGFNYLGRFDAVLRDPDLLAPADESPGRSTSRRAPRPHRLDVAALVAGGCLQVSWSYSARLYDAATVERLADAYGEALRELATATPPVREPVSARAGLGAFADFGWSADDLSEIGGALESSAGGSA